jgi:hypothetical protein
MYNYHDLHDWYFADHYPSVFVVRMVFIEQVQLETVRKYMACLSETQLVLGNVSLLFQDPIRIDNESLVPL